MRGLIAILVLGAVAVVASACGGSEGESSGEVGEGEGRLLALLELLPREAAESDVLRLDYADYEIGAERSGIGLGDFVTFSPEEFRKQFVEGAAPPFEYWTLGPDVWGDASLEVELEPRLAVLYESPSAAVEALWNDEDFRFGRVHVTVGLTPRDADEIRAGLPEAFEAVEQDGYTVLSVPVPAHGLFGWRAVFPQITLGEGWFLIPGRQTLSDGTAYVDELPAAVGGASLAEVEPLRRIVEELERFEVHGARIERTEAGVFNAHVGYESGSEVTEGQLGRVEVLDRYEYLAIGETEDEDGALVVILLSYGEEKLTPVNAKRAESNFAEAKIFDFGISEGPFGPFQPIEEPFSALFELESVETDGPLVRILLRPIVEEGSGVGMASRVLLFSFIAAE